MHKSGMARGTILALMGIAAALLGGGIYYWTSSSESGGGRTQVGKGSGFRAAPDFHLPDATGQSHGLTDFRGKVTLLHFWASWCPPCLAELPQVLAIAKQFEGRPIEVVLVSLDDNWKDAEKALQASGSLPKDTVSLIDPSSKVPEAYGSYQFPETYLLDGDQRIVTKWVGGQDWKGEPIQRFLDKLLGGLEHPSPAPSRSAS